MATRSGDVDPGIFPFFARQGMDTSDIDELLNKKSGILGLSGCADHRELLVKAGEGDKQCQMAFDVCTSSWHPSGSLCRIPVSTVLVCHLY